jgi:lipopolysaccharide/colanic/teichoic acid biosynthesis glycosyltransferase
MWRSMPELVRFALDADRAGDVAFKVAALVILSPVLVLLVLLVLADLVYEAVRR